ncbi:hypothetical protein VTG60DRAFT_3264 [Thermothelomyces hinnuleus]
MRVRVSNFQIRKPRENRRLPPRQPPAQGAARQLCPSTSRLVRRTSERELSKPSRPRQRGLASGRARRTPPRYPRSNGASLSICR